MTNFQPVTLNTNWLLTFANIFGLLIGYLVGSIPSAVWVGRTFYGIDVREYGSGNAGATNTFRVLGKKPGIAVLIMDVLKGFFAVKFSFSGIYRLWTSACSMWFTWSHLSGLCWIQRWKGSGNDVGNFSCYSSGSRISMCISFYNHIILYRICQSE